MSFSDFADDEYQRYRGYADQMVIFVRPIASLTDQEVPAGDCWFILAIGGASWDKDQLIRGAEQLVAPQPYELKVRDTHTSWGFDAASYEISLQVAEWALTSAAWDVLKALVRQLANRLRGQGKEAQSLSVLEVEGRAQWIISELYAEEYQDLQISSTEIRDEVSATIELVGRYWRYEVDLELVDGLVIPDFCHVS